MHIERLDRADFEAPPAAALELRLSPRSEARLAQHAQRFSDDLGAGVVACFSVDGVLVTFSHHEGQPRGAYTMFVDLQEAREHWQGFDARDVARGILGTAQVTWTHPAFAPPSPRRGLNKAIGFPVHAPSGRRAVLAPAKKRG